MSYSVSETPTVFVDHEALENLSTRCGQPGVRAALVGFGEYAKHLINLHPEHIVGVYDPDARFQGIWFRSVPVVSIETRLECNLIACCEYKLTYDFMREVAKRYPGVEGYVPPRLHYKSTNDVKVFDQEALYRQIFREAVEAPISMMGIEKLQLLMEILRYGLQFDGHVVEMGSWQGGSTWYIAKLLQLTNQSRTLYAMDLFEQHMIYPTATSCTDEVRRRLAFYDELVCIEGLVDADECLARISSGPICFAHIDLGCLPKAMSFVWDRMPSGAPMLLDNYGHLAATWEFEDFFDAVGARIIRFPWSEQGLVLKR